MVDHSCAFRMIFWDIKCAYKQLFCNPHLGITLHLRIKRKDVPGPFHGIALKFYIPSMDNTIKLEFNWRSFGVPAHPKWEIDFLLHLKIKKVSSFVCLAKLFNLLSDPFVTKKLPCFSKVYYFLEWGSNPKILSMSCRWEAVIPLEDTMSVLVLSTQSGSSCEVKTFSSSAIVELITIIW